MLSFRHKPPKNAYLFQMVWKKITISLTDVLDTENRRWRTIWTLKIVVQGRNQIFLGAKDRRKSTCLRAILEV